MKNKIRTVAVYGFFGAICRTLFYEILQIWINPQITTLLVNILGSFLFGFFLKKKTFSKAIPISGNYDEKLSGFFGSFTTFAMLEYNLYEIFYLHNFPITFLWVSFQVIIGLALFKGGTMFSEKLNRLTHNTLEM